MGGKKNHKSDKSKNQIKKAQKARNDEIKDAKKERFSFVFVCLFAKKRKRKKGGKQQSHHLE